MDDLLRSLGSDVERIEGSDTDAEYSRSPSVDKLKKALTTVLLEEKRNNDTTGYAKTLQRKWIPDLEKGGAKDPLAHLATPPKPPPAYLNDASDSRIYERLIAVWSPLNASQQQAKKAAKNRAEPSGSQKRRVHRTAKTTFSTPSRVKRTEKARTAAIATNGRYSYSIVQMDALGLTPKPEDVLPPYFKDPLPHIGQRVSWLSTEPPWLSKATEGLCGCCQATVLRFSKPTNTVSTFHALPSMPQYHATIAISLPRVHKASHNFCNRQVCRCSPWSHRARWQHRLAPMEGWRRRLICDAPRPFRRGRRCRAQRAAKHLAGIVHAHLSVLRLRRAHWVRGSEGSGG